MDVVSLLVWLAVFVIVIVVAWWLLNQLPLDPMARQIITIAIVVICAIIVIAVLLRLTGVGSLHVP
jgi:hypothetical protein